MRSVPALLLFAILIFSRMTLLAQTGAFEMSSEVDDSINVNQTFTSYSEIYPFRTTTELVGMTVTANIKFLGDESLVRFILVDNNFNEYLIYETYSLLEDKKNIKLIDVCEETDRLDIIVPYSVKIEVNDAEVELVDFKISTQLKDQAIIQDVADKKRSRNKEKINKLNKNLSAKGKHWRAGMTSLSEMSYQERKKLYGQGKFRAGFEYYSGGIVTTGEMLKSIAVSEMVNEWDWRNRHGQNWITPVKNQGGCGSCWAFSVTGTTEAMANLYFNQSDLDLNLSEQDVLSCSGAGDCDGGYTSSAMAYIRDGGIVDEAAFPYSASDESCENKNGSPTEHIQISDYNYIGTAEYPRTEDGMKKMLIEMGPLSISVSNWSHAIVLVGYNVVEEGDVFYSRWWNDVDSVFRYETITIGAGDPLIGTTVWIMKNSWGSGWGDEGYVYVQSEMTNLYTRGVVTPVISTIQTYDVICEDNDGDGYYWWGLGDKPEWCDCPETPDGDDSDNNLGPLDEFGNCIILGNPPIAKFGVDDTTVYIGDEIAFNDESTGGVFTWYWDFGDGLISTAQNPVHQYATEGLYTVSLIVSNPYGADTLIKTNYISVDENVYFQQDSLALVALYNSTNGPNWTNNDNWLSGPLATWYGIELNDSNRVSVIDLRENNLQGVLPVELGGMNALLELRLSNNNLVEIIPQTWSANPNLWTLDLSHNQLGGQIPEDWSTFTGLSYLNLGYNQLTDSLRSWYTNFTHIWSIQINNNNLFGSIPESWAGLFNLGTLNLGGNELSGSLPECITSMYELYYLNLGNNNFSGNIPESWSAMRSIRYLYLYGNQLNGSLPDWLGDWRQLSWLYLSSNQFTGEIPGNWANLSSLYALSLSYNQLEGAMPEFLADSSETVNLRYLYLNNNNFSGEIPVVWSSYSFLQNLNVSQNDLTGAIPYDFCSLDSLPYLNISFNYFDSLSCSVIQCMLEKEFGFSDTIQMQKNGFSLLNDCGNPGEYDELVMEVTVEDAPCNGEPGELIIHISGGLGGSYGIGGYSQEANNDGNAYVVIITNEEPNPFLLNDNQNELIVALDAGTYSIVVEDAAGNDIQEIVVVMEPEPIQIFVDTVLCEGSPTFVWNSHTVQTDRDSIYSETLTTISGCDSISELLVSIQYDCPEYCPQYFHPVWEGSGVYEPMNIFVVDAKIDGIDLEPGDQIGVFDGEICVGYGQLYETIEGENILSIVVGADDGTGSGFTPGNDISYKIWRCSDQEEFSNVDKQCYTIEAIPILCSSFQASGSSYVALSVTSSVDFAIDFTLGWNIFSSPVIPDSSDMEFVFSDLINENTLLKIQDETGASLEDHGTFGGWVNNIGNLHPAEGYKVKVAEFDSLYISGQLVNYPYGVILNAGWNIIGFPSMQVVDGMEVVQQLIEKGTLIKVQDQQGNSIEDLGMFGGWQNFIGNFWAGRGFKVKVSAADTLWIYENYPKSTFMKMQSVATTHFNPVFDGNGVDHMNFNFVNLSAGMMKAGDELAVFDGDNCVGATTLLPEHFKKEFIAIPASAGDESGMAGFSEGSEYSFRLWQTEKQTEVTLEPELIKGEPSFAKNESAMLSMELLAVGLDEPAETTDVNCYPNPFNEEITINVQLAADANVEVQVINQTGQCINRLMENQNINQGAHKLKWTGRNDGGQRVSTGIYYLRITVDDRIYNKKIVYNR